MQRRGREVAGRAACQAGGNVTSGKQVLTGESIVEAGMQQLPATPNGAVSECIDLRFPALRETPQIRRRRIPADCCGRSGQHEEARGACGSDESTSADGDPRKWQP
jgi:hypothetical protein